MRALLFLLVSGSVSIRLSHLPSPAKPIHGVCPALRARKCETLHEGMPAQATRMPVGLQEQDEFCGVVRTMIVVVDGISASGKTTWCAKHGGQYVVPENGRFKDEPNRLQDPVGAAAFWAERNVDRWQAALATEAMSSWALCDSDPLKLHYIWSLWQIGEASEHDWRLELAATRETVAQRRIGFADCYIVGSIDPQLARERANADTTRRRRNFELHVRLQTALLNWYSAIEKVLPGRVQFGFPSEMPALKSLDGRYALEAFDQMIASLPRPHTA